MDSFKLDSQFKPAAPLRNCANCAFVSLELPQGAVQRAMICRAAPPTVLGVPSPDGRGMQTFTMWPVVTEDKWCHTHRFPAECVAPEPNSESTIGQLEFSGVVGPKDCFCSLDGKGCIREANHPGMHATDEGVMW